MDRLLGAQTVEILRKLNPDHGDFSFEELCRRMLSCLTGIPLRRAARSGQQHGVDALASVPFAAEFKRHDEGNPPSRDQLQSKLERACERYPDLQLWVLVSTAELSADDAAKLTDYGYKQGVGVLILDPAASASLVPRTHSLAALCAADLDLVLGFLTEAPLQNSDTHVPFADQEIVRDEILEICSSAHFQRWLEALRRDLVEQQPLWRQVVKWHNESLVRRIAEASRLEFGTGFVARAAISRTVRGGLQAWFDRQVQEPKPSLGVISGDRYDGKTWLVFQWLCEVARELPIPVFFIDSARGLASKGQLTRLLEAELEEGVPVALRRHVPAWIEQRSAAAGARTPWALVILDGLNEYAPREKVAFSLMAEAIGSGRANTRPALVLSTVRARSWEELKEELPRYLLPEAEYFGIGMQQPAGNPPVRAEVLELGPFDDREFREACERLEVPSEVLSSIPTSAAAMLRRPRYLGLIVKFAGKLGRYTAVTLEVLSWLDLIEKAEWRSQDEAGSWNEEDLQELLKRLAKAKLDGRTLDTRRVVDSLRELVPAHKAFLQELASQGVLHRVAGGYEVDSRRLTLGHALYLLEELDRAHKTGTDLKECLRDLLAPLGETDEGVAVLRAAAALALLPGSKRASEVRVVDAVLRDWLQARNRSRDDLEAVYAFRSLLLDPLQRQFAEIWPKGGRQSRLRDLYSMVLSEVISDQKEKVSGLVKEWFRLVPATGSRYFPDGRIKRQISSRRELLPEELLRFRQEISTAVAAPELADLGLQTSEDLDVEGVQGLGLYLAHRSRELVRPSDLLAFAVSWSVAEDFVGPGEMQVLRDLLGSVPSDWFLAEAARLPKGKPSARRQALRSLVRAAERADLQPLWRQLKPKPSRRWRQHSTDWLSEIRSPESDDSRVVWVAQRPCDYEPRSPTGERPPADVVRRISEAALRKLAPRNLGDHQQDTRNDLDFEPLLPVLAAWAPEVGARIVRYKLRHFPDRVEASEMLLGDELLGHACLLTGAERGAASVAELKLRGTPQEHDLSWERLALALLPGSTPAERVDLLVNHPWRVEPGKPFRLFGKIADQGTVRHLQERLESGALPQEQRRLRLALSQTRSPSVSPAEHKRLLTSLRQDSDIDLFAALELAFEATIRDIPTQMLEALAGGARCGKTYAPWFAARMLADRLPPGAAPKGTDLEWRAWQVSRDKNTAAEFLIELSAAISRYQFEVSARRTDDQAASERVGAEHQTFWSDHELPLPLLDDLEEAQLSRWLEAWERSVSTSRRLWSGAILSCFKWSLLRGSEHSARLWPLARPFQRERFGGRTSWTFKHVDSALFALNWPESDDALRCRILQQAIADAPSDWELQQLALAAHYTDTKRLQSVALELTRHDSAMSRAKGCFLLGWLASEIALLEKLASKDPSLRVRWAADRSAQCAKRDSWCRHWWERFLTARGRSQRWAAGQLFLASADLRSCHWAEKDLGNRKLDSRRLGEGWLLVWRAEDQTKRAADKLKDTFLGDRVKDLEAVAFPWKRDDDWVLDH